MDELGSGPGKVGVLVVNRTLWHAIRVRDYESDVDATLVPLADVLDPIGVKFTPADVTAIDTCERKVAYMAGGAARALNYDRLAFALGSRPGQPTIPGLADFSARAAGRSDRRRAQDPRPLCVGVLPAAHAHPKRNFRRRAPVVQAPPNQSH